jgi:hypothetical protein
MLVRKITLAKNGEWMATLHETVGEILSTDPSHPRIEFSDTIVPDEQERIQRISTDEYSQHRDGKFIPAHPGTVFHFQGLPRLFREIGYQAELGDEAIAD